MGVAMSETNESTQPTQQTHGVGSISIKGDAIVAVCQCGWRSKPSKAETDARSALETHVTHVAQASRG